MLSDQANFRQLKLSDKGYQGLIRSLSSLIKKEQRLYVSRNKNDSSTNNSRLELAADTFRKLTEIGCTTFRARTSRNVLFHIKEVLPLDATIEVLCTPLVNPYIKCLLTICSYPPHLDHLQSRDWSEIILFCASTVSTIVKSVISDTDEVYSSLENVTPPSSQFRMPVSCRDMLEVITLMLGNKMVKDISVFSSVFMNLKFVLESFSNETAGHALIFECLSILLTCVTVEDITFAKIISITGLTACLRVLEPKAIELREQLCVFICHSCRALRITSPAEDDISIKTILIACCEYLINAKVNSPPFRLYTEDVTFLSNSNTMNEVSSWSTYPLIKLGYKKPLLGWLSSLAIARLVCLIESDRFNTNYTHNRDISISDNNSNEFNGESSFLFYDNFFTCLGTELSSTNKNHLLKNHAYPLTVLMTLISKIALIIIFCINQLMVFIFMVSKNQKNFHSLKR